MKKRLTLREICIFSILGTIMYCSKLIMEVAPNIHLLGMFTMVFTIVYRKKALIPLYIYIFLNGFLAGFAIWWTAYLYIWTILWGITMLIPENISDKKAMIVYPIICGLHGLLFGLLYAPTQALFYGLDFKGMLAWIIAGTPFDIIHALGDFAAGFLVLPMSKILKKAEKMYK